MRSLAPALVFLLLNFLAHYYFFRLELVEDKDLKCSQDTEDNTDMNLQSEPDVVDTDECYFDCDEFSDEEEYFDCRYETFDLETESSFPLPFKTAEPADEVCLLMNKLILDGKLSTESFFYKNIKAVTEHLIKPTAEWDFEVCEALQSIQHAGGAVAVNYVVGPLGKNGPQGLPLLNYGGPSYDTIKRRKPGVMPVSGIAKHLLLSTLQLLELSDVKTMTSRSHLFAVSMQLDGTMLRAGLII